MTKSGKWMLVCAAIVSTVTVAMAAGYRYGGSVPEQSVTPPSAKRTVQSETSNKCQTPVGLCIVSALPIGSRCTCPNGEQGTIIP